jgi:hypothetical protein
VGPLQSDELSVPTEDSVGRDERGKFGEGASPDGFSPDRKPATLIVGQAESPATELLLQDAILLAEILDDRILLATNPAGQGGNEDLPRLEHRRHP